MAILELVAVRKFGPARIGRKDFDIVAPPGGAIDDTQSIEKDVNFASWHSRKRACAPYVAIKRASIPLATTNACRTIAYEAPQPRGLFPPHKHEVL